MRTTDLNHKKSQLLSKQICKNDERPYLRIHRNSNSHLRRNDDGGQLRAGIEGVRRYRNKWGRQECASQCRATIKRILAYKKQVKIGLFESCYPKSKDHLAEKGDTARHGDIQEAGRIKSPFPDENRRPAS